MSDEAQHTLAIEEAVVGEPAHQADVVGLESHDDTAREPLANGLKDQNPVVPAVAPSDGIEAEVPAQKVSDISQSPELGTPNLPEERMTQAIEQDVQTREDSLAENTKQSDAGNFSSLSSHVSGVNEATGEGGSLIPDASTQGPLAQLDDSKDDPSFSDIVEDSVITHIEETPVEIVHPVSEVTSGNPYLALEEPSIPEDSIKEQPVVQNRSFDVAHIANEASLADSTLIKSKDSQEEYNVVDVKQQEATDTIEEPIERKANNAEGQFEPTNEAKSTSKGESEMEEETMKGMQQKNAVLLQDSHASDASPVEEAAVTGDDAVVAHENNVPIEEQKVGPGVESFQDSQEDVAMLKGAPLLQSLTTENGEGSYGMGHEGDRELDPSKNEDKGAEGKEKESSSVKFTLVVTGVAFAAVGVALASFHCSH